MDDTASDPTPDPVLWVWQGFFGPYEDAVAGKAFTDALPGDVAGVKVPVAGDPPVAVDLNATTGMFAIQVRPAALVPTPAGLMEANPAMVGRLVGA